MYKHLAVIILLCSFNCIAQTTPPWSRGTNDPVQDKGIIFHVDDVDNVPDLHGNPQDAKLVLFIGGNQFFVMPRLIAEFTKQHPDLSGRIFYETLPPGILRKQMAMKNTITLGNLTLHIAPDVYEAGATMLDKMHQSNQVEQVVRYATNNLEIMIAADNPKHIEGLKDLAANGIRLSMPNVETEGVAKQIQDSLRKAGGDALVHAVYDEKVRIGTTFLTQVHHRQTPMRILQGESDAGVVWGSEVRFQQKIGNPVIGIPIPEAENTIGIYAAAIVSNAPHRAAAEAWLAFLRSPEAQSAYAEFGFMPYVANGEHP